MKCNMRERLTETLSPSDNFVDGDDCRFLASEPEVKCVHSSFDKCFRGSSGSEKSKIKSKFFCQLFYKDMDEINRLSDELLIKILSFVPTKVAVSTSILSKRWEFLWMWLPKLEYDDTNYSLSECERLRSFLDRNLPLHRAPVIERLGLQFRNPHFKPEDLKLWVLFAVSRCVRELTISYSHYPTPYISTTSLYTCSSLVILKLVGDVRLDVPRMAFLPSLKTLQLQWVIRLDEKSFHRLVSICPVLEDLTVQLCDNQMRKFTVMIPSLLRLTLSVPYGCGFDELSIDTPSLKYFKFEDQNKETDYSLIQSMPKLREAYIDVSFSDISNLIGSIKSVKRLTIASENVYGHGFVFNQLEHLKLSVSRVCSLRLLVRLLKDSPNLRELEFFELEDDPVYDLDSWIQPRTVPKCLLTSLEVFFWPEYSGNTQEKELVIYILKNACRLNIAKISSVECDVPKLEMIKELALSPRASTTCQLVFD